MNVVRKVFIMYDGRGGVTTKQMGDIDKKLSLTKWNYIWGAILNKKQAF